MLRSLAREFLKPLIPQPWLEARARRLRQQVEVRFAERPPAEVFTEIYEKRMWGKGANGDYYSGAGSHDSELVATYLRAVRGFLAGFETKPDIVDLGCGDFNVGARLRSLCGNYIACDVVEGLVERNRATFTSLGVDFRRLDITEDELPPGRVVLIRQVLQHLSNAQIARVVPKLAQYEYLVLTEHVPSSPEFVPNRDKPAGPYIRMGLEGGDSGVVLTEPPFSLPVLEQKQLCETPEYGGMVRTIVYKLH